jgi:chromosome partitioning protein
VLVVDLDPQGNATMGSGIDKRTLDPSVYDVLLESASIAEARRPSPKGGYDVVGANRELAGAEVELVGVERRDRRLRAALAPVADAYDFVLVDCPPSLSLLTLNGLACAHGVVVPMQCEYFALEGLSDLVNTIKQVHANLNPELEVIGILRVMFDPRITLQAQVSEQLKAHFGDRVFDTVIPRNVRLAEAPSYGMPGLVFDPASKGALAFLDFAREMAARADAQKRVRRMNPAFPEALLARIEDAGINASAPREQLWIDGWLVRFSPGKAKRARCVQAVAAGRLPLDERIARCLAVFAAAGCRAFFRITPFSRPKASTTRSPRAAWLRIDDTRVMVASLREDGPRSAQTTRADGLAFRAVDGDAFADWVGEQRGSSAEARAAHAERIGQSPVPHRALVAIDRTGRTVAGGQVVVEGELAGLYDIFSVEAARGRGVARALCRQLLRLGVTAGARDAYLQVEASNAPARRVYERLGFADGYAYHYRSPPAGG